jgi:GT2 family glycosyltransferase
VEPSVTAVVITRRDPRGLAALLDAVFAQTLTPDAVLVLDRTAGAALAGATEVDPGRGPGPDSAPGGPAGSETADAEPEAADAGITVCPPADAGHGPTDRLTLDDGTTDRVTLDHGTTDRVTLDHGTSTVAGIVDAARRTHRVPVIVRAVDPRTPARAAAHRALLDHELDGAPTTLAWLLPVGTTPEPGTLVALVDTWRRSPSAGLIGPKHLDADDPHLLRALAIRTTRGGRLLSRPAPGEPDQGQYDRSSDALGVPFAGSLVERDLLVDLRGWETSFGDVGADLDLGWRAHNAGRRVVVVPAARMHTEPGVAPAGASTASRRRSARRVALARSPWWASPFLAAWIAVTSVVAAVGLLLLKRPRSAGAELSSLASLDPFRGTAARWRTRHRREVSRRDLRALFEPRRAVLTGWGDAVHDALVSPRPPIGDEANDLNPRSWMVKVVRHPGVLAAAGAAVVSAVAGRSLGVGVITGAGSGLSGGELMGNRADASVLWHAWTDGWTGAGLGGPDPVGPWAPLLALPTWLVDHLPLLPAPGSAAGLVVALLVILGMPLAAVSAYVALRPVVATRWVRGLAAFAWATTGVASASVAQGRLGALVALILLPPIACGLWLLATRRSTATSAFATALATLVLGAFAPVLLALVCALALVLAVVRSQVRRHALVVAVVPVAVLAPWFIRQGEASWPVLVAGAGLAQWGGPTPKPWQLALLNPGGAGAPLVWTAVPLVAVAVLALLRGRAWGSATTSLTLLAPVLLALALVAPGIRLGTVPAGVEGAGEPIMLWSGLMLLPFALVLVLAVARGLDGVPLRRPVDAGRVPAVARRTGVTVGVAAVVVSATGVAWATLGTELAPWQDPRPAVSVDQAEGAFATRALFVTPGNRGAGYRFVGREASDLVRPLPDVADADGSLADRVSAALGDASTVPTLFADTATDLLAVRSGLVPEVARRLDATDGLQRVAPRDGWDMWRVSPTGTGVDLVAPPRLRLQTPDGSLLVATTGQTAGTRTTVDVPRGSRLVVAEPLGWADHAVVDVDGVTLSPVGGTATPTYALPVGTSRLTVTIPDPYRWWHVGQGFAFLALAFLAIPFGRRESRVGRR